MHNITILGDGAFGTAIAHLLATNGHTVSLWCYNRAIAESINLHHKNPVYGPDVVLPKTIRATTDIAEAVYDADFIFEAIPVKYLRDTLTHAISHSKQDALWILLSKGIESTTLYLPSDILDSLGKQYNYTPSIVIASGPSFAHDIVHQQPTGIALASSDESLSNQVAQLLNNNYFHTTFSYDVLGVQMAAALKNVYAIGMAIIDTTLGDSSKALFMMLAIQEIKVLLERVSGNGDTVYTFAGLGDLILTCYSKNSRNVQAGMLLAHNKKLKEIELALKNLPEGINTLSSIEQIQNKYNLRLPIAHALYKIAYKEAPISTLLDNMQSLSE